MKKRFPLFGPSLVACGVALSCGQILGVVDEGVSDRALSSPVKPLKAMTPSEMAARFFFDALQPFGKWVEYQGLGLCWQPNVGAGWAPYSIGRWAFSDMGWVWVSDEEFGGIVFHYGRWARIQGTGWVWVPDMQWAPAWVAWRYGTDHLGWAPLPPSVAWDPKVGVSIWVDREYSIGPENYRFCPIADFGNAGIADALVPVEQNGECVRRTVNITNLTAYKGSVFTGGVTYDWISSRTRVALPVVRVVRERSLLKFREALSAAKVRPESFAGILKGKQLVLMAPEWALLADPRRADSLGFYTEEESDAVQPKWVEGEENPLPPKVRDPRKKGVTVLPAPVLLTGWEAVADDAGRKLLQAKVAREVGGLYPNNSPAKKVDPGVDLPSGLSASR